VAIQTLESAESHFEAPTFDPDCFAVKQSISYFLPARRQNSLKSRAGDIHSPGAGFLIQSLEVFETNRLSPFY
jgi:hypothetical protein